MADRESRVAAGGGKFVLYGDVAPTVDMMIEQEVAKGKTPEDQQKIRASAETQREVLTKNVISSLVQDKLMFIEWEREIPAKAKNDSKFADQQAKMEKRIRDAFEKSLTSTRDRLQTATPEDTYQLLRQEPGIVRLALLMKERHLESL